MIYQHFVVFDMGHVLSYDRIFDFQCGIHENSWLGDSPSSDKPIDLTAPVMCQAAKSTGRSLGKIIPGLSYPKKSGIKVSFEKSQPKLQ